MNQWDKRFMELTRQVASWSSCFKSDRQVGAVIVKNKRILTTGYNGAPEGVKSCKERGECMRMRLGIASGTRHELLCRACGTERDYSGGAARDGA